MFKKATYLGLACCFMVSVAATAQQATVVLPRNSVWKYLDNGSDPGTQWKETPFNDASWASGPAELGYGDGGEATVVSYGPDGSHKFPATYFRLTLNLSTLPASNEELILLLKRDDGAVVYINGNEVLRENMPSGTIDYLTWAAGTVDGSDESTFFEYVIDPSVLQTGNNLVAVEIHQDRPSSSDISFDLELQYREIPPLVPPVVCDDDLDSIHISRFVSVMPGTQPDSIRIPETHTFQLLVQSGDPYSDTTQGLTKGLFDFTGYVPIDSSSENGYLSINHELGSFPAAGVSMLSLNFDTVTHVWNVTNNVPVDFGPVNGTGRNCSGTVTPWNTIVTSEETLPTVDANNDGYQDIGWHVEIDPATASIREFGGTPQKLWRMGRMSHENLVVAADRKTAYYGNDENPGFIFKYVADQAEDLSNGSLYVLKLDGPLDNTTTGSWIGIPNSTPADCNNTRAYAEAVGGTNFRQVEDVEISPLDGKIYFTSKSSSRVYRFRDEGNTVSAAEVFVGNSDFVYVIETASGLVEEQWRGGVDNLTFDNEGNLYVLQDGGRNHIWMVPPCHTQTAPAVKLFCVTPAGCEPTGMTFSPDSRFMFVSLQHPAASNATEMIDATGTPVKFDRESALVIARKEVLGPDALSPVDTSTTIDAPEHSELLKVYPNPTDGQVYMLLSCKKPVTAVVRIYTALGASVRLISRALQPGHNTIPVDMNNLPAGVYTAHILVGGQTLSAKIVKQ